MIDAEQDRTFKEKEARQRNKEYQEQKRQANEELRFKREESLKGMGAEALKLGGVLATTNVFGQKGGLVGNLGAQAKQQQGAPGVQFKPGGPGDAPGPGTGSGIFSNFSGMGALQGAGAGGLAGFGLTSLLGKGKKTRLLGGLGGALLGGFLGGGGLSSIMSMFK
jgi:hypothetical protein